MSVNAVPEGWKNRLVYTLDEAATVWAFALYDRPMNLAPREARAWDTQRSAARNDLRASGYLRQEEWTEMVEPINIGGYVSQWRDEPPRPRAKPVKRKREWFEGPDLATYAKERGFPGLFGFNEGQPVAIAFNHDTELLKAVRWAIKTYWEDKDPGMWPNKDLVVEKLMDLRGLTKNEAEAVDLVTRHDSKRRRGR